MNKKFKQLLAIAILPALALMVVGCDPGNSETNKKGKTGQTETKKKESSSHFHGSHKGSHVYQIGDSKYWYEVFYDAARETANIHILKSDKKTPLLVPAETITYSFNSGEKTWDLKATEAKDGNAYKFSLEDGALVNALSIGGGELILKVGDKELKSSKPADPNH